MTKQSTPNKTLKCTVAIITFTMVSTLGACGKRKLEDQSLATNPEDAVYEVHCPTEPPPPPPVGSTAQPEYPIPATLPTVRTPIELETCGAFTDGPQFLNREMPALVAIADCKSRVVRFKSRDYQVYEGSTIAPDGGIDMRLMYIGRLAVDAQGTPNCWTRMLGHITGKAYCGANASDARLDFTATWTFDLTPPELMEPAAPGMADIRNGKHCVIGRENCTFKNTANIGCGG